MTRLAFHPLANIFPLFGDAELDDLAEDIRAHGQREPIMLAPDQSILDGRNRYLACLKAGAQPIFNHYAGEESAMPAFVVSMNMKRRMLDEGQRGMIATRLANLPKHIHADRSIDLSTSVTQAAAAALLNVSVPTVKRARVVVERGVRELIRAVEEGSVSVSAAARATRLAPAKQRAVAAGSARAPPRSAIAASQLSDDTVKQVNAFHREVTEFFIHNFGPRLTAWIKSNPGLDSAAVNALDNAVDACEAECVRIRTALMEIRK